MSRHAGRGLGGILWWVGMTSGAEWHVCVERMKKFLGILDSVMFSPVLID